MQIFLPVFLCRCVAHARLYFSRVTDFLEIAIKAARAAGDGSRLVKRPGELFQEEGRSVGPRDDMRPQRCQFMGAADQFLQKVIPGLPSGA